MAGTLALVARLEVAIAGTFLVLMVVLIFAGGVSRMLGTPLNWTTDLATCLFAWACFLAADIAWRNNSMMSIEMVTSRLGPRLQSGLRLLNYALIAGFLLYLVVMGLHLSWTSRIRSFQGIPEISYSWVTMSLPVGSVLLLMTTWRKIRAERRGAHEQNRAADVL